MTATEKLTWVGAFNEGVMFARSLVPPNSPGRKEIDDDLVCPLTLGEIRAALDHFYDDTPENGPIPVNEAWVVITMRAQGASSAEIERITAKFRAAFATTK